MPATALRPRGLQLSLVMSSCLAAAAVLLAAAPGASASNSVNVTYFNDTGCEPGPKTASRVLLTQTVDSEKCFVPPAGLEQPVAGAKLSAIITCLPGNEAYLDVFDGLKCKGPKVGGRYNLTDVGGKELGCVTLDGAPPQFAGLFKFGSFAVRCIDKPGKTLSDLAVGMCFTGLFVLLGLVTWMARRRGSRKAVAANEGAYARMDPPVGGSVEA